MSVSEADARKGLINDQMGQQLESLSAQVEANLERGRNAWAEWRVALNDSKSRLRVQADRAAHEHPWEMVAGAAVVGVLLGLLLSRR